VPDGVYDHFAAGIGRRGANLRRYWTETFAVYRGKHPELATEIEQMQRRELASGIATCRRFRPTRRGSPDARPRARC